MRQTIRTTEPIHITDKSTLSGADIYWDGGETGGYAVITNGPVYDVTVLCFGRSAGIYQSEVQYSEALRNVKVWRPVGHGVLVDKCWGSSFHKINVQECVGTAVEASIANATTWENVSVHGGHGLAIDINAANVILMRALTIEHRRCDVSAVRLVDIIGCLMQGLYMEDNQDVQCCISSVSTGSNKLNGSGITIETATVSSKHEKHDVFVSAQGRSHSLTVRGLATRDLGKAVIVTDDGLHRNMSVVGTYANVPNV